jgi:hypothetical protein
MTLCNCGVKVSCSWCHAMNDAHWQFCKMCGHEVNKPRVACQCRQCRTAEVRHRASLN